MYHTLNLGRRFTLPICPISERSKSFPHIAGNISYRCFHSCFSIGVHISSSITLTVVYHTLNLGKRFTSLICLASRRSKVNMVNTPLIVTITLLRNYSQICLMWPSERTLKKRLHKTGDPETTVKPVICDLLREHWKNAV